MVGILNVIYGIAAIGETRFFVADQKYILSGLHRADRLELPGAGRGDGQQARAAGEDRRAGRAMDHAPADHAGGAGRERDQRARGDEQRKPPRNTLRRPKTSPSAPEVTITAAPTSE